MNATEGSVDSHESVSLFDQVHGVDRSVLLSVETRHKVDADNFDKPLVRRGRLILVLEAVEEGSSDLDVLCVNDLAVDVVVVGLLEGGAHHEATDGQAVLLGHADELAPGLLVHVGVVDHHALLAAQGSLSKVKAHLSNC